MLDEKDIKQTVTDKDPKTRDFYDSYDEFADITDGNERRRYETMLNDADITDEMRADGGFTPLSHNQSTLEMYKREANHDKQSSI